MVRVKLKHSARAKASSILEVLISMVIILIVFGIAMMISANLLRSSLSIKKINAQAVLSKLMIKIESKAYLTNKTFKLDSFIVEQEFIAPAVNPDLIEVHLTAYDVNQEKITDLKKLIIKK